MTIKVEEALESCSALRRFAPDFHICFNDEAVRSDQKLIMTFDIPPPAKYIITESAMGESVAKTLFNDELIQKHMDCYIEPICDCVWPK